MCQELQRFMGRRIGERRVRDDALFRGVNGADCLPRFAEFGFTDIRTTLLPTGIPSLELGFESVELEGPVS